MFLAIVMACSLTGEAECIKFTDTRGPYLTEESCRSRVNEMITDLTRANEMLQGQVALLPEAPTKFLFKCDNEFGLVV